MSEPWSPVLFSTLLSLFILLFFPRHRQFTRASGRESKSRKPLFQWQSSANLWICFFLQSLSYSSRRQLASSRERWLKERQLVVNERPDFSADSTMCKSLPRDPFRCIIADKSILRRPRKMRRIILAFFYEGGRPYVFYDTTSLGNDNAAAAFGRGAFTAKSNAKPSQIVVLDRLSVPRF